ncbi:MAG: hypothetical protein IPK76_03715 [Lewinellaceae bacterium]|nr:hypothetical protein [Lewinellaceae bacterium]
MQYDLQALDVALSGDTVAVYDGFTYNQLPLAFGWMERAPNGHIYVVANCCFSMHVIENPDLKGLACDVQQHSIDLPTWIYGSLYFPTTASTTCPTAPAIRSVSTGRYRQHRSRTEGPIHPAFPKPGYR